MIGKRLTYPDLHQEVTRLAHESVRVQRMLTNIKQASGGQSRSIVLGQLSARRDALDRQFAALDRELWERRDEAPVCVICGDINVCQGGDLCHSCSRDLGVRRAADMEVAA